MKIIFISHIEEFFKFIMQKVLNHENAARRKIGPQRAKVRVDIAYSLVIFYAFD